MVHMAMATVQQTVVPVVLHSHPCRDLPVGMVQLAGGGKSVGDMTWLEVMVLLPKLGDMLQGESASLPPMSQQGQPAPAEVECGDWHYTDCVVVEGRHTIC